MILMDRQQIFKRQLLFIFITCKFCAISRVTRLSVIGTPFPSDDFIVANNFIDILMLETNLFDKMKRNENFRTLATPSGRR